MPQQRLYSPPDRPVLTLADILGHDPTPVGDGELRLCCPLHGGHNPTAFAVNVHTGLFHCFACGVGGKLREYWGKRCVAPVPAALAPPATTRAGQPAPTDGRPKDYRRWMAAAHSRLPHAQAATAYLAERGISVATAMAAGVGCAPRFRFGTRRGGESVTTDAPALLFGLRTDLSDHITSVYARGCVTERRHRLTHGRRGVFLPPRLSDSPMPSIVVEGCLDALALRDAGYGGQICALVGLRLHPLVFSLSQPILLAFDDDDAGRDALRRAQLSLTEQGIAWLTLPPQPYAGCKDIAAFWQATRTLPFAVVEP